MSDRPELSVVVLSYNNADYVEECLHSLTRQGVEDYEVYIIDDSSTDDSVERINHFIKDRPAFHLIEKPNSGGAISSSIGIDHSTGEYLAIVDSDDIVMDGAYRILIDRIKKDGSDFAAGTPLKMDLGFMFDIPRNEAPLFIENRVLKTREEIVDFTRQPFYWNIIYKTDFIKDNSVYMPDNLLIADRIFLYRAVLRAKKISIDRTLTYSWRQKSNPNNLSITDQNNDYHMIVDRCDSFLAQMRLTLEEADQSAELFRAMWSKSFDRFFFPIFNLFKDEDERVSLYHVSEVCDHYRTVFMEYPMFFYRLINDSDCSAKAKYVLYLILKKEYDTLYNYLNTKTEVKELEIGNIDDAVYVALLDDFENVYVRGVQEKNGKILLLLGGKTVFANAGALEIVRVYAVSRFFAFNNIAVPFDAKNMTADITSLIPSEYSLHIDYRINGKPFSEKLNVPKNYAHLFFCNCGQKYVQFTARYSIMRIGVKSRFTLMQYGIYSYICVNDDTIDKLFFYNIENNHRTDLDIGKNRAIKIDSDLLKSGTNILMYKTGGLYNTVRYEECTNDQFQFHKFEGIITKNRIEIKK